MLLKETVYLAIIFSSVKFESCTYNDDLFHFSKCSLFLSIPKGDVTYPVNSVDETFLSHLPVINTQCLCTSVSYALNLSWTHCYHCCLFFSVRSQRYANICP